MKFANVAINLPVKNLFKQYTYIIPEEFSCVDVGWRVVVPFGMQTLEGFVVARDVVVEEPSDKFRAIEALIDPIRRAVSKCYIAGNVAGTVRDTIQGLFENLARSINKYQTDITAAEVLSGYKEVIVEGPQNIMTISKLN